MGGLSILLLVPVIWLGEDAALWLPREIVALTLVLNAPHFMASYWLVYSSRETASRHRAASLWVPLGLFVWVLAALYTSRSSALLTDALFIVAGGYLAWHYTGQAWGMMAVFSRLAGRPFDERETRWVKWALRILLVWHVSWFAFLSFELSDEVAGILGPIYTLASWATLGSLALSAAALAAYRRRSGVLPPVRTLVPWAAIYVWYAAMARFPDAIFYVQLAHALQYLIFPARVEMNRMPDASAGRRALQLGLFVVGLLVAGVIAFEVLPAAAAGGAVALFGANAEIVLPRLVFSFINVHHYFTDGVIWKLSNPEVRRQLFAHLPARA